MIICVNCKRPNEDGTLICKHCNEPVDEVTLRRNVETVILDELDIEESVHAGQYVFGDNVKVVLYIVHADQHFEINPRREGGAVIGRTNPAQPEYVPDVDLRALGGHDLGISRIHARLVVYHGILHIIDLGSANGSYVNGLRLTPYEARPLQDGDEINLARCKIAVSFQTIND